jgi:para-nitrobenzyl esterase
MGLCAPLGLLLDCLILNVFTPSATAMNVASAAPLAVLVWTYGGSFLHGGISLFLYEASNLARAGVVVVTINYRLGALGWLYHDDLAKEDPSYPTSGNYGLLDQQMALKWVQANIASFGGDPTRVTLSGESAGSILTCFQVIIRIRRTNKKMRCQYLFCVGMFSDDSTNVKRFITSCNHAIRSMCPR